MVYKYNDGLAKKSHVYYSKKVAVIYGVIALVFVILSAYVFLFTPLNQMPFWLDITAIIVLWSVVIVFMTIDLNKRRNAKMTAFYVTEEKGVKIVAFKQTDFNEANSSTFFSGIILGIFNFSYFDKENQTIENLQDGEFVKNYVFSQKQNNKTMTVVSVDGIVKKKNKAVIKGLLMDKKGVYKYAKTTVYYAYGNVEELLETLVKISR